jgi:hypothetical protein
MRLWLRQPLPSQRLISFGMAHDSLSLDQVDVRSMRRNADTDYLPKVISTGATPLKTAGNGLFFKKPLFEMGSLKMVFVRKCIFLHADHPIGFLVVCRGMPMFAFLKNVASTSSRTES